MKKAENVVRILLGLLLVIFGPNKFFHFIAMDPSSIEGGLTMNAFVGMGIITVVGVIEVVSGALLLANKQTGVALFFLAPIAFCAFLFHLVLDPQGIAGAIFFLLATGFLMYCHKDKFLALMDQPTPK